MSQSIEAISYLIPSVNKFGDIVTLGDIEYRWRDGVVLSRKGEGELRPTNWISVFQSVRDAFNERENYQE